MDHLRNMGNVIKEYQIWQYYTLNNGQTNRIFVFLKANSGKCEFDLIHSTVNGEYQNPDWINTNNWREILRRYSDPVNPLNNIRDEELINQDF